MQYGTGWICGGGGPEMFSAVAERVRAAWADAGREGTPRLAALAYFTLGNDAREVARSYLTDYYGFLGELAEKIADSALTDHAALNEIMQGFAEAGCDEVILFPCSSDIDQVGLLPDTLADR